MRTELWKGHDISEPVDFKSGVYHFYNTYKGITPVEFIIKDERHKIKITGKSLAFYRQKGLIPAELSEKLLSGSENIQLTAIAAGLDETLDYALKAKIPPIIIDPIEPEMIQEGLNQLLKKQLSTSEREMAAEWLSRAEVYKTDKVRHYKMTLKEALAKYRDELLGQADVVMDLFGVWYYHWWRRPKYELLLKTGGLGLVWASKEWASKDQGYTNQY